MATQLLKHVVKTRGKGEDGAEADLELAIVPPSGQVWQKAKLVHARAYKEAVEAGAMIRQQLDKHLRKMNLWDDERQAEFDRLRKAILDAEYKLDQGGLAGLTKKAGRALALGMARDRAGLQALLSTRGEIEGVTADVIAEQAQFNYLVAATTVYNEGRFEGKPYFTYDGEHASAEKYLECGKEPAAFAAAAKVAELLHGDDRDAVAKLPENRFLKKYGYVDDDFNLVDPQGRRVDEHGKLIDEQGYYVDGEGERVDAEGRRVDAEGRYVVAFAEFLDDDDEAA